VGAGFGIALKTSSPLLQPLLQPHTEAAEKRALAIDLEANDCAACRAAGCLQPLAKILVAREFQQIAR
jgi:hypothetical protein